VSQNYDFPKEMLLIAAAFSAALLPGAGRVSMPTLPRAAGALRMELADWDAAAKVRSLLCQLPIGRALSR